jgi:tripartite-type tricarboxylate transporter receptor subunit TctC
VRPLAIVSAKRSPVAPELPALGEVAPGYDAEQWYGVFAPAGTPRSIVATLNAAIVKDLQTSETRTWLSQHGAEAVGSTPEQFGARIKLEVAKWTRIVRETGTKPQ